MILKEAEKNTNKPKEESEMLGAPKIFSKIRATVAWPIFLKPKTMASVQLQDSDRELFKKMVFLSNTVVRKNTAINFYYKKRHIQEKKIGCAANNF